MDQKVQNEPLFAELTFQTIKMTKTIEKLQGKIKFSNRNFTAKFSFKIKKIRAIEI